MTTLATRASLTTGSIGQTASSSTVAVAMKAIVTWPRFGGSARLNRRDGRSTLCEKVSPVGAITEWVIILEHGLGSICSAWGLTAARLQKPTRADKSLPLSMATLRFVEAAALVSAAILLSDERVVSHYLGDLPWHVPSAPTP